MHKGDTWLPQKIARMPGKIHEGEADATGGVFTLGPKLTIPVTRKVATSWFQLLGKKDCLFCHIMRG